MNPTHPLLNDRAQKDWLLDPALGATALSDGNPGAAVVCAKLIQFGAVIDPLVFAGGVGYLFALDSAHVYGPRIWALYKNVCKQNLVTLILVLRAAQINIITNEQLQHAIDNRGDGLHDAEENIKTEIMGAVITQFPFLSTFKHENELPQ